MVFTAAGAKRVKFGSGWADDFYRAIHIVIAMDILQAIRNLRQEQQLDPLGSLELWQDTGSAVARQALGDITDATPQADPDPRRTRGKGRLH
ncbi:hypothetical protein [Thiohalophilus sp.]|uniref:hypothetical protein n=1 Tax=Thiohalophilus sp. TaxID=3028392 RepID=UPI002ACDB298|nr:hypothetical protein [Thiohalophilus sp.]MDZ7661494.1 hypothetical protein [Thiohalophilus sp.]